MRKGLLMIVIVLVGASLPVFAANSRVDIPDSVIIADVVITPGQTQVVVPVYFVTHEDISHYALSLAAAPADEIRFAGFAVSPALQGWDDNWQGMNGDRSMALHLGFADLGGEDNAPLNTAGQRVEAFQLILTVNDNASTRPASITATVDRRVGAALFGFQDGVRGKTPVIVSGRIANDVAQKKEITSLPTVTSLGQNYPNPFNPTTEIQYALPDARFVKLSVFNVLGQEVRTLVAGQQEAGYHKVIWDGRNNGGGAVPSGVYFYKMEAGDFAQSMKMVLLK